MYFAITHLTTFSYSDAISDSVMEVWMQPRNDAGQRCMRFELKISPKARAFAMHDYLDNTFHVFDIPGSHRKLAVRAESIVETKQTVMLPDALEAETWAEIEAATERERDLYDMLLPSTFARRTPVLDNFAAQIGAARGTDPLSTLRVLNTAIYRALNYMPNVTTVDSPIDDALLAGQGVCQDFAHIMITLVRGLGIPCRYVSGYLFYQSDDHTRSQEDATHAWVEAWLPGYGWTGFDPTNDLICGEHHISAAVGRDYADVPPTKGVFLGVATSFLEVSVKISQLHELPSDGETLAPEIVLPKFDLLSQQHQQQQQ